MKHNFSSSIVVYITYVKLKHDILRVTKRSFFSITMIFTRNNTTSNTYNSAPITIYCAVGGKSKF